VSILASFVPSHDRIITIENVSELDLPPREHWIRLVGKTANMEGKGEISLRVLVKNALRMRPDRIILGEARGGEALDVVQAMHTGHDGVITVLHGNSPQAALERLQTLMLMSGVELPSQACQMQIASAVELMVHMSRYADGSRRIASIAQIGGSGTGGFELEELFTFDVHRYGNDGTLEGALRRTDIRPKCLTKFQKNNVPIPLAAWQ
jgi:pilus assembly protein CpaF